MTARVHVLRPKRELLRFSGLLVWAGIILVFGLWLPHTFLTVQTARIIAGQQAVTGILALSLIPPLAAEVYDLSVAAMLGVGMLIVLKLQGMGVNWVLAVFVALIAGSVVGGINAIGVVKLKINAFIMTLGMSSILSAVAYMISNGTQIAGAVSAQFISLGQGSLFGIPLPLFYLLALAAVMFYVFEYTPLGRYFYATGGNRDAARLAGIRVNRVTVWSLVASGVLASFAGCVLAASIGSGSYDIGPPYLLPAFSAVFLGATQIVMGRVNVLGTLIAVYLLATGVTGLELAGAPPYTSDLFDGVALILAVGLAVRGGRLT
jgi:ribose transport system permease protein